MSPFTIPSNDLAGVPARQSVWYDVDIAILVAALAGTGVLTGCAVTAQGSPDMTLAVASGMIQPSAGVAAVSVAAGNVTIGTAHATLPRIDLVTASAAGVKTVTAGTASAEPKPADLPSGHVALAMVDVPAADTAIGTAQITDKRAFVVPGAQGLPMGLTGAVSPTRYVGGTASGAPATGTFAVGDFTVNADGSIYICTVAGSPGTWAAVSGGGGGGVTVEDEGTPLATVADTLDFVGAGVVASGTGTTKTITISGAAVADILDLPTAETDDTLVLAPDGIGGVAFRAEAGGATEVDPILDTFGAPDTAFEFATSSLTGLTALGSPAAEDADTTVPDHYYIKETSAGTAWCGRYLASPSDGTTPFTLIAKITDTTCRVIYNAAGIFIAEASPGVMFSIHVARVRSIFVEKFSNPSTYNSSPGSLDSAGLVDCPVFLGIRVNSTTSVDYFWSRTGRLWVKQVAANNPSFTIGAVGIAAKAESATLALAAAFDFLRIWNSSKTFPAT